MSQVLAEVALLSIAVPGLQVLDSSKAVLVEDYVSTSSTDVEVFSCTLLFSTSRGPVEIEVPEEYPRKEPRISLRHIDSRGLQDSLRNIVTEVLHASEYGVPILDKVIFTIREFIEREDEIRCPSNAKDASECSSGNVARDLQPVHTTVIHRRILFWSHHLLAISKRKDIKDMSNELEIRTIIRRGYPGLIASEGPSDSITEFVKRVKSMRWAAITLRFDKWITVDNDAKRQNRIILKEHYVETEDMSVFCKALEKDEEWKLSPLH